MDRWVKLGWGSADWRRSKLASSQPSHISVISTEQRSCH